MKIEIPEFIYTGFAIFCLCAIAYGAWFGDAPKQQMPPMDAQIGKHFVISEHQATVITIDIRTSPSSFIVRLDNLTEIHMTEQEVFDRVSKQVEKQ